MTVSEGPILGKTFGLFILPMAESLKLTRGQLSLLPALAAWAPVLATPAFGYMIDRWGARQVMLPGFVAFAIANAGIALFGDTLPQLRAWFVIAGIAGGLTSVLSFATLISTHFTRNRGLVLGIALGGGSALGATIMPQVARFMIDQWGWQSARLGLSVVVLAGGLCVAWLLSAGTVGRPFPASAAVANPQAATSVTRRKVWSEIGSLWPHDTVIWLIIVAGSLTNMGFSAMSVHLFPLLVDRNVDQVTASSILSLFGFTHFFGQLMAGYMLDRVDRPQIAIPFFTVALVGLVVMYSGGDTWVLALGAVLMGWGHGAELSAGAYFFARYLAWGASAGHMG